MKDSINQLMDERRAMVTKLCQDLVRAPSVDRETDPSSNTRAVSEVVTGILEHHGLAYRIIEPLEGHPNVVARVGKQGSKRVVLNGHLDHYGIAPNEEWQYPPFSATVAGGRIYGRGTTDMKGGDAALITAFLVLAEFEDKLEGEVVLTLFSDEETGAEYGAQYVIETAPEVTGDVILSAEPTGVDNIRFGERGASRLTVTATGISGHGGSPWRGRSATAMLVAFLQDTYTAMNNRDIEPPAGFADILEVAHPAIVRAYGPRGPEFMTKITYNIGVITGGVKDSIVADKAEALIDVRSPAGHSHTAIMRELTERAQKWPGIEVSVRHFRDPNYSQVSHPMFRTLQQAALETTGQRPWPCFSLGGTDLRFWRQRGIPGFAYGPGPHNIAQANEYVEIDDLITVAKVHALAAFDYLSKEQMT